MYHCYKYRPILTLICRYYGKSVDSIKSSSRERDLVLPRHMTMYILKADYDLNDAEIGSVVNRTRGTVYSGIKQIENLKTYDTDLLLDLVNIRTFIQYPSSLRPKHKKIEKLDFLKPIKRIYQYDLEMNQVGVFDNINEAVKVTGVSNSTITKSLAEYKKEGKHYYWIKK